MTQTTRAAELYARALELIPGGVNSPVRAMKAVGLEEPLFAGVGRGPTSRTSRAAGTWTGCSRGGR